MHKAPLSSFLARNPFPDPLTLGFFYREKMRAIHRITPNLPFRDVLEVGGGRSGLGAMLFPQAQITNIDMNPEYADAPCNTQERVRYVVGDATDLPFEAESFDAITMFDLLEHVPAHEKAVSEAMRVLRPGGFLLVSSPADTWRFPYYSFLKRYCPHEQELFEEWGHVRRGYSLEDLRQLIPMPLRHHATFINPATVLCHDVSFSRLPYGVRKGLCVALAPVTALGYVAHRNGNVPGTETATAWQKA
jgi:SAM-dependent methyltransferase